jgi:cytochrome P450
MMQPQFHRQNLNGMMQLMLNAIIEKMQDWDGWANSGEAINMLDAFNRVTMAVIVRTMFGEDLNSQDAEMIGVEMAYALDFMLQNMVTQSIPNWLPVPGRKRYQEALHHLDEFLYRIIAQRRKMTAPPTDMLGMLLNLIDDETGAVMTDQQIRDEIATLFLAGYETTSLTLSWGVHHLLHNPQVVEKLQQEMDSILGNQEPTLESVERLHYTRTVLQEIMRIHPPAFWIPRTAIEDDEIDGYPIHAGQMIGVSIYSIHHNASIWDDPESFQPERFADDHETKRHALAWMPFGAGQRMCIGRDFSMLEGTLILARLIQHYTLISTGHKPIPSLSTTLRPKNGVWMKLAKRR